MTWNKNCLNKSIINNVDRYYKSDAAVIKDNEVQLWANEIAYGATGTSESGKGKVGCLYLIIIIAINII